ncbi:amino acid adenylation domain-containing protein [Salmonella enterica subsp. enterica serovar Eastbourne]|nr:hypothetical protein [Salmonella enterica]EDH3397800.1 hypothetical protein [Salmonella enterica]EDT5697324.1 amino acid adenylation domain-containing protein [Salmonella enterica subsp. enterica serovar Eastbourne]EGS7015762.1 amino acid adenylation domain-containing protein [Salmonella enterica]EHB8486189.1 amino acid adenylation domain-containing protein [Salmonella enterica]
MEVESLPTLVTCIVSDGVITQDELRHWLSQRLPHYMVPHRFFMLSDLPLTLNRKVDMRALAPLSYQKTSTMVQARGKWLSRLWHSSTGIQDRTMRHVTSR